MNLNDLANDFVNTITKQQEKMVGYKTDNLFDIVKVYFVTVKYNDCFSTLDAEKKLQTIHSLQDKFFGHLLRKTVPRYMKPKNRKYQPVSLDFVDFPGTRKSFGNTLAAPHVHSILVVHPNTQALFDRLMKSDFLISKEDVKTKAIQMSLPL